MPGLTGHLCIRLPRLTIIILATCAGWAIHTPHEVVWVHEMMDMPENDRIIEVKNIREILGYLI